MIRDGRWRGAVLALICVLWAQLAAAQEARFEVSLKGVKVAELAVTGTVTDGRYAVQVRIRSDGLAGILRRVQFTAQSEGSASAGFAPERYTEKADTGRRQSEVKIVYDGGAPQVLAYTSPRPDGPERLDPATQTGTLDPATALFAGLRDLPLGQSCKADFAVFDGRRRSAYTLSGNGVICSGEYRRVAGYTPEEMAERTRFPLEVIYTPEGDVLRVVEASVQTIYGKVRLKRR